MYSYFLLQECGGLFVYFYESGNVFHEKVVRDLEELGGDSIENILDRVLAWKTDPYSILILKYV